MSADQPAADETGQDHDRRLLHIYETATGRVLVCPPGCPASPIAIARAEAQAAARQTVDAALHDALHVGRADDDRADVYASPATAYAREIVGVTETAEAIARERWLHVVVDAARAPLLAELQRVYRLVTHWNGEAGTFEAERDQARAELAEVRGKLTEAQARWERAVRPLWSLADFLVGLDEPGSEARRTITLNRIIEMARTALGPHEAVEPVTDDGSGT